IDPSRIEQWLGHCDKAHVGICDQAVPPRSTNVLRTLLLVDIAQGCLVRLPTSTRYFALSYVWGNLPSTTETRKENLDFLCSEGTITATTRVLQLPNTIRDALRLLQRLGEKYLWVDRLCIVQDDEANRNVHITNMDSIYANAYCTIVAADGEDADYGLPGAGLRPRHLLQRTLDFPSCSFKSIFPPDATRGWTLQEVELSRRRIIFYGQTMFWECNTLQWQEEVPAAPEVLQRGFVDRPFRQGASKGRWPNLEYWGDIVKQYSQRTLTFPSDAQAAFSGIESALERSFPGGFLYGLPEFFFDEAVLWLPLAGISRRNREHKSISGYHVPSWSWLGWAGDLSIGLCKYEIYP
ncbi:heterokaryon incompatibility protein-domain-containing protein, partial [Macrophomina phaseolina]